ncbi:unnamed protein product [Polarella glacialis]|uniref:Protein kinase domain-containing protein n=2 Tax=Polarella glacialis TaxID=89957 RepID=A0A813DQ81_POLGL|nr:unnamed protein product [Polarella glacialis]CAE8627469.1 unnamed protein product [Polarella glacialis]
MSNGAFEHDEFRDINILSSEITMEEVVGTGCTAEVYRGTFGSQVVAIKQMTVTRSSITKEHQVAFARELKVLTKVCQENLVKLYGACGVCSDGEPLRIVTEFCAGGACFELLHNSPDIELQFSQQTKMCFDVALAMEYLHTFKPMIIHRDLKSLNLLLDKPVFGPQDPVLVKVSDFGVAKIKDGAEADWGKMTVQAGTKHWMAPEMWSGTNYDEKVDVYSYAMVIYEIFCREVPFEEEEPSGVAKFTLAGVRPDMDAWPPNSPPKLRDLMLACWAQDPIKRPSFIEVVNMLPPTPEILRL